MTAAEAMPIALIAFASVAAMTWFFSYRPRLFVRMFVSRDELRGAIRGILRAPNFGRNMRIMALLQFGVAVVFAATGLWLWFG